MDFSRVLFFYKLQGGYQSDKIVREILLFKKILYKISNILVATGRVPHRLLNFPQFATLPNVDSIRVLSKQR